MSREEILSRVNVIISDLFDDDELTVTEATVASDVEGWDSLAQVRLMLTVEREFGVKFSAAEVGGLKNVGDLLTLVASRLR